MNWQRRWDSQGVGYYILKIIRKIRMDNAFKIARALGADISEVFYFEEEGENSEEEEHDS